MHAISEPNVRFWRPQAPMASSGVPEMLSTPDMAPVTRSLVCQLARGPVRPNGVSDTWTRRGLAAARSSRSMPSSARNPGAVVSMTRSADSARRRYAATPSGVRRSMSTACLPPSVHQSSRPPRAASPASRIAGPDDGRPTRATDAPLSARILPAKRPSSPLTSITRRPLSGPPAVLTIATAPFALRLEPRSIMASPAPGVHPAEITPGPAASPSYAAAMSRCMSTTTPGPPGVVAP